MNTKGDAKMADKLKRANRDFFIVHNMIFEQPISEHAKIIYLYLCRCADGDGNSFPSHSTIGEKCGIKSRQTVINALKELEKIRLLSKQSRRTKSGGQTSNLYTIHDTPVQQIDTPLSSRWTPPVQQIDTPCPVDGHEVIPNLTIHTVSQSQSQSQTGTGTRTNDIQKNDDEIKKEPLTHDGGNGSKQTEPANAETETIVDHYKQYIEMVKNNIDYFFIDDFSKKQMVDELLQCMAEVFAEPGKRVRVAGKDMPKEMVVSTFLKLTSEHIDHVLERIATVKKPIKHTHAYIKTCLFHAPAEYETYMSNLFARTYR